MAAARKRAAKRGRSGVRRVRTVSTFPPEGLFTRDAATIARVMATRRVSPGGLGSAIRMVQLVLNRGGKGLTASRRRTLERAKRLLQDAAARERAAERIRAEASRRRRRRAQLRRSRSSGMPIAAKTPMSTRPRKSVPDSAQSRPSLSHAPAERASKREQMRHTRVETARRAALERGALAEGQLRPRIAARDNTQMRHSGRRIISTRARRRSR